MKYSRTAIGLLTAQYRSVLKKCLLINLGLFALGAVSATPANADTTTWSGAITATDDFMDNLATTTPTWDRNNGVITGWGVDQILNIMTPVATATDAAISLVNNATKGNEALYTALGNKLDTSAVIGTDGTASDSNVYSASAINTKLGNYLTSAIAASTYQEKITTGTGLAFGTGEAANTLSVDFDAVQAKLSADQISRINGAVTGVAITNAAAPTVSDAGVVTFVADTSATEDSTNLITSGAVYTGLAGKQAAITSSNKLDADLVDDSTSTNKFVTSTEKTTWNNKQDALNSSNKLDTNAIAFTPEQSNALNSGITAALKANYDAAYTAVTTLDTAPTENSTKLISSGAIYTALGTKQNEITSSNKLGTALIDTTDNAMFVTSTEKATWNAKQNAITGTNMLNADYVDDTNTTHKFATTAQLNAIDSLATNYQAKLSAAQISRINSAVTGVAITNAAAPTVSEAGVVTFVADTSATENSTNLITSGAVYTGLAGKQAEITSTNKLSADLIQAGTTNAVVTVTEKSDYDTTKSNVDTLLGGNTAQALGTAAFTAATAYATSAQGAKADSAIQGVILGTTELEPDEDKKVTIGLDATPTENSTNLMNSGALYTALATKQAKLTEAANGGDGIAISEAGVISVDLADAGGLEIDANKRLKAKIATTVAESNTDLVNSDLLAKQNYLKNGTNAKLTLSPTGNTADLAVMNGSNLVAGININGGDTNSIALTVNNDSNVKKAAIDINESGAFYTKTGTAAAADEIVTLGTAANGTYTNTAMTGVNTISGALDALQSSKQNTLTADNAGAGLAFTAEGQVLSVGATDASITVGADGIAVKHDGSLAVDATNGLGVNIADETITKDATSGAIKVGTIAQSQVSGLDTALAAKADINGTNYVSTTGLYGAIGTQISGAITAAEAAYAKLANGNEFTDNQKFGVMNGTTFQKKAIISGSGTAAFGMNDANTQYAMVIEKDAITANQSIAAKQGITFGTGTGDPAVYQYYINSDGTASLGAISAASLTATGNVQAAGLTFDGSDIATSITKATSEASATEVALATAGYAVEQAKAAADAVVDATDTNLIKFKTSAGADEAETYNAAVIGTGYTTTNTVKADIASKQAQLYYTDTTSSTDYDMNAKVVTEIGTAGTGTAAATASDANLASELAVAKALATKQGNITPGNGLEWNTSATDTLQINLKEFAAPVAPATYARGNGLALDSDGLSVDLAAYTPGQSTTDAEVAAWVAANATKLTDVYTTAAVLGDKMTIFQNDLFATGSTANSIAAHLGATGDTTLTKAVQDLADGQIAAAATAGTGLAWTAATADAGAKLSVVEEVFNTTTPTAPTAAHTFYDAQTIFANFAQKSDPSQTITAAEVDTKALKVANPLTGADENVILSAEYDATNDKNVIALNGATTVTGGLTADTLTLPNAESGATPITVSGIKGVSGDNAPMLITAGAVDAEFNTKVGTIMKETLPVAPETESTFAPASVQAIIGLNDEGKLVFDENIRGVSNILEGDGNQSKPTTLVEAFQNIGSAMGKIHGLATNNGTATEPDITVNNNKSIFKAGNIVSSVTGETITSNLPTGTSVEEMEVYLDNAIGNIESGDTLVGKAYADEDGNRIKTTYAKDADVVHKAGAETITGMKTFQNGLKVGADWQMDENPTTKAFIIRDASTAGMPAVAVLSKNAFALSDGGKTYFNAGSDGLVLKDITTATATTPAKNYFAATKTNLSTYANGSETFRVDNATGDLSASKGKFTVVTDTADATKVKASVAGDIEATGNVKAASLTLPNVGASADVQVTAIDAGAADAFDATTDAGTLATMASVNKLAEKATFTPVAPTAGTVLTSTTIGDAINELNEKKFDKTDIVTTWSATTSDTKVASEKLVRDTLDDILDGDTPFTGFTMTNNAATPANVKMLAIDDGNYSDELATTFATNLSVKSAVNKLVFGGNPNIWTGVNEFQNTLKVTKNNGSSFDTLFMVDNTSGNTTIASLKLGDYATAMNGIDLMPTLNSYNHLVTSGGVYDALQGTGTAGETINFGSRAEKTVIGQTAYNMTMDTKTGITTIGDGTTTGNIQMNKGALTAGTSVKVGSDSANSLMNASGLTVKNGDDNVAITSNSITLTDSGTSVFNVDQYGAITAGKASDAGQFSFDTHNGTASITTSKAPTISAAIAADGDSAAMEATDGTYDYLISANADMTTPADRGVVVGVTATGQNKLISGFEADNDSVGMGMADSNGDLVAGFSADKAAADQNIIEMGAFDNTDPDNPKLDTGVSVDSKGKTVSIAAAGNEVVNVSYDTTKGKGLVGVTGDLTATGNFSADNAGFTVSHNDTTGKTDVVATGDVKAASLTLPNLDQTTTGATITATAIDNNATAFPTSGAGTTLATLSSIQNLAAQGAYTPGDQNSWRNPYAGDASTKPTTIAGALDRLATNLDAATNSLGDWSTLNAHVTASGYTGNGNITVTGTDPYKAPSAVSAVIDLDDAIGYRTLYNNTHYANTTGTAASVSQAIANMDTKVYEAIHGTGTPTAPDGKVFVGDAAKQIVIGNTKSDHKQYIRIDQESEQTLIGNTTFGETIDSINKVATIGGTNPNHYKMTLDGKNQKTTFGTPTNNITMEKGDLTATGNITAKGALSAENGTFTVTNDGTKTTMALTGDAQINGDESVTGKITVQATGSNAKVEIDHAGTITATDGTETAQYDAAGITLNNGTDDTFTVDTTNGDMMAAAGNFAVTTADGSATSLMSLTGDAVISGDTKTTTFTMPDADQPAGAPSVVYAQVTGIDKGTTAANSFSDAALATTQSIKTKAENADYTPDAALKAAGTQYATANATFINEAIKELDLQIGDWNGLNTENGNLTNGHAGDAGYNMPETVVDAFNNIDATLGTIHGLAKKLTDEGTYKGNLASGTTVEQHLAALDTSIGNRNGYTAAYNINRGESVAESLNNIDLRLGDVKSLNNMNYYGEQNPNDVNLTGAVRALDNNLYRVEHDLKTLRHETHAGLASAAALSALVPNPRGTGDTTLSFGTGAYQGHTAAALGGFHWITNNLLVNAGVGWDNREATTRIGVSYSF